MTITFNRPVASMEAAVGRAIRRSHVRSTVYVRSNIPRDMFGNLITCGPKSFRARLAKGAAEYNDLRNRGILPSKPKRPPKEAIQALRNGKVSARARGRKITLAKLNLPEL